jgi:two-component system sensor histidine kinase BaeS
MVQAFNSLSHQLAMHERARREFASDVSHELHALASAMQTAADAFERGAADQDPVLGRRLVAGLVSHTRRLNRLADDLLELARWEAGRLRIETEDLEVGDLVQATVDEWAAEAQQQGVALEVSVPGVPLTVRGDPVRLVQALGNLLENALKYAGVGGRVSVDIGVSADQRRYEIAVADSGPGIPPEILPRVFDRYFRVEGRAGSGPGGMGLGLAIARSIALAHGGDLVAESPPGGGARFVLSLPVDAGAWGRRAEPRGGEALREPVAGTA